MTKKNKKISQNLPLSSESFRGRLAEACAGLTYISETDAEIIPFWGERIEEVSADSVLEQAGEPPGKRAEEASADAFFERLTEARDWHGPLDKERTERFSILRDTLMSGLSDLRVFRVGKIRINIYVVGRDSEGLLGGVKTKAVET